MARISKSSLKNWNNGETMYEADYEKDRDIIVTAVNDTQDTVDSHRDQLLELNGTGGRLDLVENEMLAYTNPVTFDQLKNDSITFDFLRQGYLKQHLREYGVNVKFFGAILDGVTDDTEAVREAVKFAEDNDLDLFVPGVAVITGEIEIKKTMIIRGIGPGRGYTSSGIADYKQRSGFLAKGTGVKRVLTRRKHRGTAADPQDNPLSVALNIQAENVVLRDICVMLDFDREDDSSANYGDDWDVGVFVGCRTNFKAENVHVMGYWREAGFYYDVTHATNLPRYNDLDGEAYDNTFNVSGGDGCSMDNCIAWGGKWGVFVAGAIRHDSITTYYDELTKTTVADQRGSFGFSDFTTKSCKFYGTDHHSGYRRHEATGDYLTDEAGGSMYVDGHASNASGGVWGHRHYSTRFSSFEPYRIRLDRAARVQLYGCHIEDRGSAKNQDGTDVLFDTTDTYGMISATSRSNHILLEGSNIGELDPTFIPSVVRQHNQYPSGTVNGSTTTDVWKAASFQANSGELDMRSASSTDDIRLRHGVSTFALLGRTSGWRSNADNTTGLGTPSSRFTQLFAATGTINTSDRNMKQQIAPIDNVVLDAWSEVNFKQFKFNSAVDSKGDAEARTHFGLIAQEIEEAFARHGLNAFEYGVLCYDTWDDVYDDQDGEQILVIPAGSRYSIRPDECMMLESALMRRELTKVQAQLL